MAKRQSAGILMFRFREGQIEYFLVHPGGPFWANKDLGAWSIPKGEFQEPEDPLLAAIREFGEETGTEPAGVFLPLPPVVQKAGKVVLAWAVEGNVDAAGIQSNHYRIEWPPHSGKWSSYPEVGKAGWFADAEAREKINPAQAAFIDALQQVVKR